MTTPKFRRLIPLLAAAAALVAVLATPGAASAHPPAPTTHESQPAFTGMLADYDAVVRETTPRADGQLHVDTAATIAKLKALHVTTYFYLVWRQASDWDDLQQEFVTAAASAGIDVWVYLVPPSEGTSQPYGSDYLEWARQIAELSAAHGNLKGWAIDDFARGSNLATFTPAFFAQADQIIDGINPRLKFLPVTYLGDLTDSLVATYHSYIDGVIFPYSDFTADYADLDGQLLHVAHLLAPYGEKAYLMPYGSPHSGTIDPMLPDYYSNVISRGIAAALGGTLGGIVMYGTPKQWQTETCTPDPSSDRLSLVADWGTPTTAGQYASASQTVAVDPSATEHELTFWQRDSFRVLAADLGYHIKQLLVDDQVAWQADAASDDQSWQQNSVDLNPYLAPGATSATLTFRLYEQRGVGNFGMQFEVAGLNASGLTVQDADFSGTGWTMQTSVDPPFHAVEESYTCDPNRQEHVFDTVASWYGPYALEARAGTAPEWIRAVLLAEAQAVVAAFRSGHDRHAAAAADLLARTATLAHQPVLAEQAHSVAADLRD